MAKKRAGGRNRQKATVVPASYPKGPLPRKDRTTKKNLDSKASIRKY